jgi:hypothetical protein
MSSFKVKRVDWRNEENPCPEKCTKVDQGYFTEGGDWCDQHWTVELNSLEELKDFQNKVGFKIILDGDDLYVYDTLNEYVSTKPAEQE